jgi:hypothetical protein
MNQNKTIKYLRIGLIGLSAILLLFLLWQNYSPLGEQTITYEFRSNPFTDGLRPSTRIEPIECLENCSQKAFDDPVYFDILLTRYWQSAHVEIKYQDSKQGELKAGIKIGNEWQYFEEILIPQTLADGSILGQADFNLKMANTQSNLLTFVLSARHIKDNASFIEIEQIQIILERDTYTKRLLNRIRGL